MNKTKKILLSSIMTGLLAFSVCMPPAAAFAQTPDTGFADEIPGLLYAGSYAEGQVVAGVISHTGTITGNDLLSESEEIMEATDDTTSEDTRHGDVAKPLKKC